MTEQKTQDPVNEVYQMINAVSARAAELKMPSVMLIGMFHHAATVQSLTLHANLIQQRQPTVAEQIMANVRSGPVQ